MTTLRSASSDPWMLRRPPPSRPETVPHGPASSGGQEIRVLDAVRQLGSDTRDLVAVRVELLGGGAPGLEQRAYVHETLELQHEIVDVSLYGHGAHAASSSGTASGATSSSACEGCDSSISAATSAPAPEIAART